MRATNSQLRAYKADLVPRDPKELYTFLQREFDKIANIINGTLQLDELHVEPLKPRDGMICFFDGTDFDPGSGRGFYGYHDAAWVFFG